MFFFDYTIYSYMFEQLLILEIHLLSILIKSCSMAAKMVSINDK